MPEEKKTTRKTAPKKTTSKKTSKKSEVVEVKEPVEPIVSEEIVTSEENETSAENVSSATNFKTVKIATVLPEEGLKIRKGPSIAFEKAGKIPAGTEVDVLEEKDGFVRIGYDQWVMKNFLGGI